VNPVNFIAAEWLWLLALLPLLVLLYLWALRRRAAEALRVTDLELVREAAAGHRAWRRHVPPALLLLACAAMLLALARPTTRLTLPSERATMVLAIDVSGSMRAADITPDRITVAKDAARAFVTEQPRTTRIGLVAFSTSAMVAAEPTRSRDDVLLAIDQLRPQRYTAAGSGIVAALQAIFPDEPLDLSGLSLAGGDWGAGWSGGGWPARSLDAPQDAAADRKAQASAARKPVPPGSNPSAVIVLLSDGRTNVGVDPLEAARLAADRGVRVFTVGFGTLQGANVDFGGGWMRTQLDEETLQAIAQITGGKYFLAQSADDLRSVYDSLTTQFVAETRSTEVTALVALLAVLLMVVALGLRIARF
jgi:Ca-activated chloride channel family protein